MCGITGIAPTQPRHPVDREALARMTGMLRHRGPDSDGFHIASGVGLGVRRLRIVDLHTGDQPIANEDGTIIVVCNGEIYNHIELRTRLLASGHRFRTASDTEVIVHLYEDHGDDFVLHLRGMFGLALWDERRRRLVLSRDRLGIKPLHYAVTVEEPSTWNQPGKGDDTWPQTTHKVYEYACHEGNYAMGNIMRGARLLEEEALAASAETTGGGGG